MWNLGAGREGSLGRLAGANKSHVRIGRITLLIRDNSSHANQAADVACGKTRIIILRRCRVRWIMDHGPSSNWSCHGRSSVVLR